MEQKLLNILAELKARGLSKAQEQKILAEIRYGGTHGVPGEGEVRIPGNREKIQGNAAGIYDYHDLTILQNMSVSLENYHAGLRSLDELLE